MLVGVIGVIEVDGLHNGEGGEVVEFYAVDPLRVVGGETSSESGEVEVVRTALHVGGDVGGD